MKKVFTFLVLLLSAVTLGFAQQISAVSDISTDAKYTIRAVDTSRGALFYNSTTDADKVWSTCKAGVEYYPTKAAQQWQFEPAGTDGQYYIKNVASGTYMGATVNPWTLVESGSKVAFTVEAGTSGGFVLKSSANNLINISNWYDYGTNCKWNDQDDGNNFLITDISIYKDVTYVVKVGETKVAEGAYWAEIGSTPSLLSSLTRGYCTYTYDVETISAETSTVTATATVNTPFAASTGYADATWYYLNFNTSAGKTYFTYDASATPNVKTPQSLDIIDENAMWAFVGNPYTGYTLYNKAAGADLVLATTGNAASDGNAGGNTYAVMASPTDATNALNKWYPANWTAITDGFTLADEQGARLNRRNAANLAFWTNNADAGSVVSATVVPTDFSSYVTSNISPYFANPSGVYQVTTDINNQYAEKLTAAQTSCTLETYKELLAVVNNDANLVLPQAGKYYTIKNYNRGGYMSASSSNTIVGTGTNAAATKASVWKLEAGSAEGSYAIRNMSTGLYASGTPSAYNTAWSLVESAVDMMLYHRKYATAVGTAAIAAASEATPSGSKALMHMADFTSVVRWESGNPSNWIFEEYSFNASDELDAAITAAGAYTIGKEYGQYTDADDAFATALAAAKALKDNESASDIEVFQAVQALTTAQNALVFNVPAVGDFIRIKSHNATKQYLGGANHSEQVNGTNRAAFVDLTGNEAQTIFYYTSEGYVVNYGSGHYLYDQSNNADYNGVQTSGTVLSFVKAGTSGNGIFNVKFANGKRFLYAQDGGYSDAGNSVNTDARYTFDAERVAELPVTISSVGYATIYAPVALSIPEGVKAYTAEVSGAKAILTEIEGTIPANTGVVLAGEAGTYNFAITTSESNETSALTGSIPSVTFASGDNPYILYKGNEGVGFYEMNSTTDRTVHGFRAFYKSSEATPGTSAFIISVGQETGIGSVISSQLDSNAPIYDLSGRRVVKMQQGIYIQNGKKIYVK